MMFFEVSGVKKFFSKKNFLHRFKNFITKLLRYQRLMQDYPLRRAHQMSHFFTFFCTKNYVFRGFWGQKNFSKKIVHRFKNFITKIFSYQRLMQDYLQRRPHKMSRFFHNFLAQKIVFFKVFGVKKFFSKKKFLCIVLRILLRKCLAINDLCRITR